MADNDGSFADLPRISSNFYDKETILQHLSEDYAEYMRTDITREKKLVEEATDELLTKLEEFLSLSELVRQDNALCLTTTLPKIEARYEKLQPVFRSIDKLEAFVNVVRRNVESLEERVVEAEKELIPENSFAKLFKPLFTKKDAAAKQAPQTVKPYEAPYIFSTAQYIVHQEDDGQRTSEGKVGEEDTPK